MDPGEALAAVELDLQAARAALAPLLAARDALTSALADAVSARTGMFNAALTLLAIRPHKLTVTACRLLRERA
ncbi:hypothetical protein BU14_0031s0092, partial [Porphyra umbilicalis]